MSNKNTTLDMNHSLSTDLVSDKVDLDVHEKELLLELVDAAINETLSSALVFGQDSEVRGAYRRRAAALLSLLYKIEGFEEAKIRRESRPSVRHLG